MGNDSSPYEAPKSEVQADSNKQYDTNNLASKWQRFGNFIIDYFAIYVLIVILSFTVVLMFGEQAIHFFENVSPIQEFLLGYIIYFTYYTFFESLFGRSIGKFATGIRVVDYSGNQPTFHQIIGRSLSRLIPFEPLSFLA